MKLDEATPEKVMALLAEFPLGGILTKPTWEEVLDIAHRMELSQVAGAVRQPEDWHEAPKNRHLRVVGIQTNEGPVIRWATEEIASIVGHYRHEYLVRDGDKTDGLKIGYVQIDGDEIRVS